jgi:hypothetical protein
MRLVRGTGSVTTESFGACDDGRERHLNTVVEHAVAQDSVVVAGDGKVRVIDQSLLAKKLALNTSFNFRQQSRASGPRVPDGETLRVTPVVLQQREELSLLNA